MGSFVRLIRERATCDINYTISNLAIVIRIVTFCIGLGYLTLKVSNEEFDPHASIDLSLMWLSTYTGFEFITGLLTCVYYQWKNGSFLIPLRMRLQRFKGTSRVYNNDEEEIEHFMEHPNIMMIRCKCTIFQHLLGHETKCTTLLYCVLFVYGTLGIPYLLYVKEWYVCLVAVIISINALVRMLFLI